MVVAGGEATLDDLSLRYSYIRVWKRQPALQDLPFLPECGPNVGTSGGVYRFCGPSEASRARLRSGAAFLQVRDLASRCRGPLESQRTDRQDFHASSKVSANSYYVKVM